MSKEIAHITIGELDEPYFSTILCQNLGQDIYWSNNWQPWWYVALAYRGFICTAYTTTSMDLLLPELQTAYAVLDWDSLRPQKAVQRLLLNGSLGKWGYRIDVQTNEQSLNEVIIGILKAHGAQCWLNQKYQELLHKLLDWHTGFDLLCTRLIHGDGTIIAGELGYMIGKTYTSLTGFLDRTDPRHKHLGKVQLSALARILEQWGMAFWNLGHPHMPYKLALGAQIIPRGDFLKRWQGAVEINPTPMPILSQDLTLSWHVEDLLRGTFLPSAPPQT